MGKSINAILLVLAAVLVVPAASYAAGLGTITVRSALGQPLDAEIEVVSVQRGEDFQVRLASREAYAAAGVELSAALQGARFAIEQRDGKTLIRVRTTQPVNDPFFTVLVELQWPTGRLARQYTVLVDPAEYKTATAAAPAPQAAVTVPAPATVAPPTAQSPSRAPAQTPKAAAKAPPAAPAQPAPVVVAPAAPDAPAKVAAQTPTAEILAVPAPAPATVVAPPSVRAPAVEPAPAPAPVAAQAAQPAPVAAPAPQPAPVAIQAPTIVPAQPVAVPTPTRAPTPVATPNPVPASAQPAVAAPEPTIASTSVAPATMAPSPPPTATATAQATAAKPLESAENRAAPTSPRPMAASVQPVVAEPTPVAAQPTPAPAVAAAPGLSSVAQASAPLTQAAAAPPVPSGAHSAKAQSTEVSDTYRIKRGDTLGAIARKWKPDGVSHEQMLVGLFQTNRPIFIRDNINLIRAGATIFIPGREDVLAISAADAARQVRTHMAAFSRYRETAQSAGGGSSAMSQAQRDVVSRRVGVKKSTRAM